MKKTLALLAVMTAFAATVSAQNKITISTSGQGKILPLNGVTCVSGQTFKKPFVQGSNIPWVRLHNEDQNGSVHVFNISQLFPNFKADENDPANYDFTITDNVVETIAKHSPNLIWRLANSHPEVEEARKYGAYPPKDFDKWARICEHIINHYNNGWANGYKLNIKYWEIWNEPDADQIVKINGQPRYKVAPTCWGGTMQQYYTLFTKTFKYLKERFPELQFGGPGNTYASYNEPFIKAMVANDVKPDFYSWHCYGTAPSTFTKEGKALRELLSTYGWQDVPMILTEWNYALEENDESAQLETERVRKSAKGTAFAAASMCHMQVVKTTDVMVFDSFNYRSSCAMSQQNGLETSPFYVFYNWGKLLQYGTNLKVTKTGADIFAAAAKNEKGQVRLMVARYNNDNSIYGPKKIEVSLPSGAKDAICTLSDQYHMNTAYPFMVKKGVLTLNLEPNAVVFVQFLY